MLIRRRVIAVAMFGVATLVASGVALAAQPPGSQSPATAPAKVSVAHVPEGNPLPSNPTVDERLEHVMASTDPGPQRDRIVMATRLAEIGPGGSRAVDGIAGIASGAGGILVALASEGARVSTQQVVEREIGTILAGHPELNGFGTVNYEVKDLTVKDQSTPGGWKVWNSSNGYCSLNSTAYTVYPGVSYWYWLTVGHCYQITPAQSAVDGTFNWASGSATGASDSGLWYIGLYPPAAASNLITDGFSNKSISTQSDRGNFDNVGSSAVCQTGATSGTGCGTLVRIWLTPIKGTYYLREANYMGCQSGDSGGPWFGRYLNGTVSLMGIHKGQLPGGDCLYSDLQLALNDRGVTLYR